MNAFFEFKTLADFTEYFCDEKTCRDHFAALRFRNGEFCPHCNHKKIFKFNDGKRYRCAGCKQDFTIKNGTIFGDSKLPLRKWFIALYLLATSGKGISSYQLAKHVGVTQKTAWFVNHRIRQAMKQGNGQLFGRIEADETYIGGRARNMHAHKRKNVSTGGKDKTPVIGVMQRGGPVRAVVAKNLKSDTLISNIANTVQKGSFVYTDEHRGYNGLHRLGYYHSNVRHTRNEFVVGDAHTNSIESFWALFKRGYHGIYHFMSPKHLQRYVDEYCFRFNRRESEMQTVFGETLGKMATGEHLTFRQLVES